MEVWPENLETVSVFLALATQWMISDGNIYGLNYQSVQSVMVMMGVKRYKWPEVFSGIHTMEQAAMQILNAKNG